MQIAIRLSHTHTTLDHNKLNHRSDPLFASKLCFDNIPSIHSIHSSLASLTHHTCPLFTMDFINRLQDQLTVPAATALMVASAAIIHNYQVPANITGVSALSTIIANKLFDIKEYIVAHIQNPETIPDTLGVALGKLFMVDIAATKDEQINGTPKTTPAVCILSFLMVLC